MRIDQHAYQRATRVASFGLLLQIVIGVTLLLFGINLRDTAFQFASSYVLAGVVVWVGLIIIFHQHKLERLEALEEDELAAARGVSAGSFFEATAGESRVAARRLALMHKWLMPALSIVLAAMLAGLAWLMIQFMRALDTGAREFGRTNELGWAVAICLFFAVVSFIFSRFIAGMAKHAAWQNLRGGAAYMVGNALVMAAVAAGIIFRFFQNDSVIEGIGWAMPVFLIVVAAEIVLNFILNLYRPRIPGEIPRPAFDSKMLSLLATPDSIVRTLNEAVNYQFGFDVTSSWGYQLLLRSFVWLAAIGIIAMILLNMMVVIEPHQQAVKLRGGTLVDNKVYESGVMWKRPWPFESAAVYDVTRIRTLALTSKQRPTQRPAELWSDKIETAMDGPVEPFIVGSSVAAVEASWKEVSGPALVDDAIPTTQPDEQPTTVPDEESVRVSTSYAEVIAEIAIRYRIHPGQRDGRQGLIDYLNFSSDTISRGSRLTDRERALKNIALAKVTSHMSRLSLEAALSPGMTDLTGTLRSSIQQAFDDHRAGVDVIAVDIPLLRPRDDAADSFEELAISRQASLQRIGQMERNLSVTYTYWVGDDVLSQKVVAAFEELARLEEQKDRDAKAIAQARQQIEQWLRRGGGQAAHLIGEAERDRWVSHMNARARASELVNQLPQFEAAPDLYRQRRVMEVFSQVMPHLHKYIIAIDPSRINVQMDLQETNPLQDISPLINKESK